MKRIIVGIRDFFELYVPIISFVILFSSFIVQVFTRYVLNHPVTWTSDLIVVSFSWLVILGACYTMRNRKHVQFTLLYDLYPPKIAALLRLFGNVLIIGTFSVLVIPSIRFSIFQRYQVTTSIRINLFWEFIPFAYFLISIILYSIPPCIEDIKVLSGKIPDSKDHTSEYVVRRSSDKNKEGDQR